MSSEIEDHLSRLRARVQRRNGMANLARWVEEKTTIGMAPFSYVGHEYQRTILGDTSREVCVRKCSQVGLSEVSARLAVAMVNSVSPLTVIYTLPTATFASTFMRSRIDPIINGCVEAKANIHRSNDNSGIKQFGDSFLYMKGAASANAPISIPADVLIHDEINFCDQEVISQYTSRLTHSKWKMFRKFSTPTIPNYGIDKAFAESRRMFNLCKCDHCAHWFKPDYYSHVQIPDFTKDLHEITRHIQSKIRWKEAALHCPNCGKVPSLAIEHREYVCENPLDTFDAIGYQVSPFDAPSFISAPDLIEARLNYTREQDFVNFSLGLPMEDTDATLTQEDFSDLVVPPVGYPGWSVMGVDVGATYHFVIGTITPSGKLVVVHAERVSMGLARERYQALRLQYRVVCTVMDSMPHSETVMALQVQDPTMYAAVYVNLKGITPYKLVDDDGEEGEGRKFTRQVNVNRSRAFDDYMRVIRDREIAYAAGDLTDLMIQQHGSMKRVQVYSSESGEMQYSWQKTDGEDHFHHACVYMHLASQIKAVGKPLIALPLFSMGTVRLRQ